MRNFAYRGIVIGLVLGVLCVPAALAQEVPKPLYVAPTDAKPSGAFKFKAAPTPVGKKVDPSKPIILTPEMLDTTTYSPTAQELLLISDAKRQADTNLMLAQRAEMAEKLARQQAQMDAWMAKKMLADRAPSVYKQPSVKGDAAPVKRIYNDPKAPKKPAKVFKNF